MMAANRPIASATLALAGALASLALFAPAAASAYSASAGARPPTVHLNGGVPLLLGGGERLTLSGRVQRAPRGARIVLEVTRSSGSRRKVARASVRRGSFKLAWTPPAAATLTLRLTLRAHGRVLAYSTKLTLRTGPAPRYCPRAPAPTSVPAGDGWIAGGLYDSGGPAPGIFDCRSGPYGISAVDEAGETTATQEVAGADYVFVLPAGSYELEAAEASCFSEDPVTVVAGKGTTANTICAIP
jgi:hypothetical protein